MWGRSVGRVTSFLFFSLLFFLSEFSPPRHPFRPFPFPSLPFASGSSVLFNERQSYYTLYFGGFPPTYHHHLCFRSLQNYIHDDACGQLTNASLFLPLLTVALQGASTWAQGGKVAINCALYGFWAGYGDNVSRACSF